MIGKRDLDRDAATDSRLPEYVVKLATNSWIDALRKAIIQKGSVHIPTLGTFTTSVHKRQPHLLMTGSLKKGVRGPMRMTGELLVLKVSFKKAHLLKSELSKHYAEGVEEDEQPRKRRNDKARSGRKRGR